MNWEIKFRGKRVDNGKWVYGHYFLGAPSPLDENKQRHYIAPPCGLGEEVDPATVGQFTGLKDKHDRMIYQDDILKYTQIIYTDCSKTAIHKISDPVLIKLVQYHPMASIVKPVSGKLKAFGWDQETGEALMIDLTSEEVEIVGDKWNNPELLEVK